MIARGAFAAPSKKTKHYPRRALHQTCTPRWKYLDAHVKMAFGPYKSQLRKAGATLIMFLKSCNTSTVRVGCRLGATCFPSNRVIEGRAGLHQQPKKS